MNKLEKGKFEADWKNAFEGARLVPSERVWQAIDLKLSDNNSDSSFEGGWKGIFQGAELKPSEDVWKAIDVSLVQSENTDMKKRVLFYQRMAAASVGIMIVFGAYSWFSTSSNTGDKIASNNKTSQETANQDSGNGAAKDSGLNSNQKVSDNQVTNASEKTVGSKSEPKIQQAFSTTSHSNLSGIAKVNFNSASLDNKEVIYAPLVTQKDKDGGKQFQFTQEPISEVVLPGISKLPDYFGPDDYSIAYRLADARPAVLTRKKPIEINESKWAAIGFSAGTFSPGVGGTEMVESARSNTAVFADLKSTNATTAKSENVKSGTSMAMTISAGKRIFKRFVMQAGVSYLNQSSVSESEIVEVAPANQVYSLASFTPETTNSVTYGSQQEINSTFQFISVPVQLGYMVIDRKFGIQVNGGVSPDFFLKNSVYNETTQVETTNSAGADGAFNSVSLSGLGSIEFSYKFLSHYRLSLAPGVRYSFTPVYNENSLASAKPFVADIGLRFRYIF